MTNTRKIDIAERWLRDGIDACRVPAYFECLDVDMSQARSLIKAARLCDLRITYTHVIVRATALALAANPDLHQMVCGGFVHSPAQVDIALSVGGESIAAPLLVIQAADSREITLLASEIVKRAPEIRNADREMMRALRRWGWLLPISGVRRIVLRALFRNYNFRRKGAGTFQVSIVPEVDSAMSPVFSASAMLVAGSVKDRVVAVEGQVVVRPTVTLTACADHRIWDGRAGQRFLLAVQQILESSALVEELNRAIEASRIPASGGDPDSHPAI
jgi:pyruvate/2-oxoglutarate dehydrogenase complex dihydrolipoamide acyltransferase (E2) component